MQLTNEKLSRRFKNQFALVNYAIKLAENMIKSGRDPRIPTDVNNRAYQILQEISEGVDHLDEVGAASPKESNGLDAPVSKQVYGEAPAAKVNSD